MKWLLARMMAALGCVLVTVPAIAQRAHTHGVAALNAAVDGGRLTLEFESPLEDLLGFERKPANDKERAALHAMSAYLESGKAFAPSAAANCRLASARVDTVTAEKDHAEVKAVFAYECAVPGELKAVDAAIFQQYQRLKRIEARVAGAKAQSAARLSPQKRSLGL